MKKILYLSLALVMSLSFTACGSDDNNDNKCTNPTGTSE